MTDRRFLILLIAGGVACFAAGAGLFAAVSTMWKQPAAIVIHTQPVAPR
jgi:hypothetical protein